MARRPFSVFSDLRGNAHDTHGSNVRGNELCRSRPDLRPPFRLSMTCAPDGEEALLSGALCFIDGLDDDASAAASACGLALNRLLRRLSLQLGGSSNTRDPVRPISTSGVVEHGVSLRMNRPLF